MFNSEFQTQFRNSKHLPRFFFLAFFFIRGNMQCDRSRRAKGFCEIIVAIVVSKPSKSISNIRSRRETAQIGRYRNGGRGVWQEKTKRNKYAHLGVDLNAVASRTSLVVSATHSAEVKSLRTSFHPVAPSTYFPVAPTLSTVVEGLHVQVETKGMICRRRPCC